MRTYGSGWLVCLVCLVALVAAGAAGCRDGGSGTAAQVTLTTAPTPSPTPTFLATGGCAAREGVESAPSFHEVPCTSERAGARVVVRRAGPVAAGAAVDCPLATDFVLYVSEGAPVARGYACMRNLEPPHPGDAGAGGGPFTVVGDCVYATGSDQVRETPCDGSGAHAPQHRVASAVARRALCPPSTTLYVTLTGPQPPVGCARRV
ncbi:hypothetical protein [Streptomyces sp. NPDC001828]|uniref:hypothetical protein n=1 Tax=Streptomyces sp. NPDC001828 TaxID=3364615 RepID=UPI0036CD1267